jgi:hypothetical protein
MSENAGPLFSFLSSGKAKTCSGHEKGIDQESSVTVK